MTRISVGDYLEGIETSADGNSVYVVHRFLNEVWAINTETLTVTAKMAAGDGPARAELFCAERCEFFGDNRLTTRHPRGRGA